MKEDFKIVIPLGSEVETLTKQSILLEKDLRHWVQESYVCFKNFDKLYDSDNNNILFLRFLADGGM